MSDNTQEQGAVLLITLLIISGLTAIGLGVSVVIFSNLRSTSLVDNSISAIYASETGLEQSLEVVNEGRADGVPLGSVIASIQALQATLPSNKAKWSTIESNSQTDTLLLDAQEGKSSQLDLFDPTVETQGAGTTNKIEKISIKAVPTSGWAEVSWVAWNGNAFISNSRTVLVGPTELGTGKVIDLYGTGDVNDPIFNALTAGQQLRAFRVNVKARFGDLNDVEIQALDTNNNVVPIPNRIYIKSRGSSGGAAVGLTASIPWRLPTSALFDFVVFSDESIEK